MSAGAVAETILSSHGGGGDWVGALKLAADTLDTLESANEELCARLLIHFLWRWAGFLGIQPHLEHCAACGKDACVFDACVKDTNDSALWFSTREDAVFCANCATEQSGLLQLNPGSRRWLSEVSTLESAQVHRYSMDNKSFNEAKSLTTAVLTGAIGKRLNSWDW
jgi:DNA repair protein RecO (recombination protein O)